MLQTSQRLKGPLLPLNLLDYTFISSTASHRRIYHARWRPPFRTIKTGGANSRTVFTTPVNRNSLAHTDLTQFPDPRIDPTDTFTKYEVNNPSHTDTEPNGHLLSGLRLALGSKVLVDVCNAFEYLSKRSELGSITGRDWEAISWFLHSHIATPSRFDELRPTVEKIATLAAVQGHIGALKALMILNFQKSRVNEVATLFDNYFSLYEETTKSKAEVPHPLENVENADLDGLYLEVATPKIVPLDMGDLFLVVVAAYATQNQWQKALDRILSMPTAVRLTPYRVKLFCGENFGDDTGLTSKIEEWVDELVICRLVSRSASLHAWLSNLAKDHNLKNILKLYERILFECRKVDGRLSVRLAAKGQGVIVVPSNTWTYFIQAFFKCSRVDFVNSLWKEVTELGVLPHPEMWFAVLDGYARNGQFLDAQAIWKRMLAADIEPDQFAYGSMIHAYFHARQPLEAISLFAQFRSFKKKTREGNAALRHHSMLPLYNIVLNGLIRNRQEEKARALMKELIDFGPKPDIVTYNVFIRHYGQIGDMQSLTSVLRALKPAGVEADNYSFTTVLSALYKAGQENAHITLLQTMANTGIQPNVAMYSAIINFLVRQGGRANFQKAVSLLTKMENETDKKCRPNEVTYTGLLAGIHRDPSLSSEELKMYSDDLFQRMQKSGVNPNRATYHYLIKASLENPEAHGLQMAMAYYYQMQKDGVALIDRTWYILLSGLVRRKENAVAKEFLKDMFNSGHQPDDHLGNLVRQLQR